MNEENDILKWAKGLGMIHWADAQNAKPLTKVAGARLHWPDND